MFSISIIIFLLLFCFVLFCLTSGFWINNLFLSILHPLTIAFSMCTSVFFVLSYFLLFSFRLICIFNYKYHISCLCFVLYDRRNWMFFDIYTHTSDWHIHIHTHSEQRTCKTHTYRIHTTTVRTPVLPVANTVRT